MANPQEILKFWFEDPPITPENFAQRMALWFGGAPATDQKIREKFEPDVLAAFQGRYASWEGEPASCLALVILLDQFSLNIYRDEPRSFLINGAALPIALRALKRGFDRELHPLQRVFLYLPLEHAEDLELQNRSVALFEKLLMESPAPLRDAMNAFHHYAVLHQEVIARFGRFPDRNPILGRPHTPEEQKYMNEGGPDF